jgi:hypothetical protein
MLTRFVLISLSMCDQKAFSAKQQKIHVRKRDDKWNCDVDRHSRFSSQS